MQVDQETGTGTTGAPRSRRLVPFTPGIASADTQVRMRLDWVAYGLHAPFFIGVEKGWFKAKGIDVSIKDGNGSSKTITLVAAAARSLAALPGPSGPYHGAHSVVNQSERGCRFRRLNQIYYSHRPDPQVLAEKSGSRTHQRRRTPLTGFEVRAPHRGAILFLPQQRPALHLCRTQTHRQGVAIFRDRLGSVG